MLQIIRHLVCFVIGDDCKAKKHLRMSVSVPPQWYIPAIQSLMQGTVAGWPASWPARRLAGSPGHSPAGPPTHTHTQVLFDDRVLHRGRGNASADPRYVGYFSYRRRCGGGWTDEWLSGW